VATLRSHEEPVLGVDYSPDGRLIASGDAGGLVKIWNAHSGRELFTFYGHEDQVFNVAFNHDGSRLASGSMDFSTIIWKVPPAGDE
jgi:WD40 repeat protein